MISHKELISTRVPKPRELPRLGTGGLHDEQQACYDAGYKAGVKALRAAQRKRNGDMGGQLIENGKIAAHRPTFSEVIEHLIEDREGEA